MSLSSVCVVSNALRLRFFKRKLHGAPASAAPVEPELRVPSEEGARKIEEPVQERKGESTMTKTLNLEGMMCAHCVAHVEKALNAIDGVSAKADLENKCAYVTLEKDVADEALSKAVEDAGYQVTGVR